MGAKTNFGETIVEVAMIHTSPSAPDPRAQRLDWDTYRVYRSNLMEDLVLFFSDTQSLMETVSFCSLLSLHSRPKTSCPPKTWPSPPRRTCCSEVLSSQGPSPPAH